MFFQLTVTPLEDFWWFHELLGTSTMDVAAPDAGHDSASVGQSLHSKRPVLGGNFGIWIRSQAARETQISGADDLQVAQEQVQHLQFFGRRGNAYCRYYVWYFVYPMRAPFSTANPLQVRFHKMNWEGSQLFVAQSDRWVNHRRHKCYSSHRLGVDGHTLCIIPSGNQT
jgi:hypothetical protein